jgi:hypothetical protein
MNLDDAQKQRVTAWIAEGLKLSDIQKRLVTELGLNLTYMEVRLLVDDLKLTPKDVERPKSIETAGRAAVPGKPAAAAPPKSAPLSGTAGAAPGGVSVNVDQVTRPGALASGDVTFSDGQSAMWYLDQMGRLGLVPKQQGYKPSPADLQSFQSALESELSKSGF